MSAALVARLQVAKPGILRHWCPGCETTHEIDIHAKSGNGHVIGWDGDFHTPTIGEPVRHETARGTCEYVLRAGVLFFLSNCWHSLRGHQRHLEEFPLP